ncbi:MAG: cyclic nucleotide-gated ion channel [Alphaproteobacteria bacterium]
MSRLREDVCWWDERDPMGMKRRLYEVLEAGRPDDRVSRVFDAIMVVLIVTNVAAAAAVTVASVEATYAKQLLWFEIVSVAIFTLEYSLRLWVSTEHLSLARMPPWRARLRFARSPFALIDLLAILPFFLGLLFPLIDLRALRIFRLLRLLKLARYSPALATLGRVVADERRALMAGLLIMVALLVVSATAMYQAERLAQPDLFGSIPQAMWWAMSTLTTVGYGDAVPITAVGRFIGGIVMVFGLGMFAMPVAIIASGFSSEIHRRDFVVTWGMVARVPLFTRLDALSVARITSLLSAKVVERGTVITRRGESPEAMYFIASGEVEVDTKPEATRLGEGEFFGEIALIRGIKRMATVRAVTRCRLLMLGADDFAELMEQDGDLREAVTAVAERRMQ